jgi:hypothetical protein
MKKSSLFLVALISCFIGFAQQEVKEKSLSKTVEFSEKNGVLLQKEFEDLGSIKGVTFKNAYIKDLLTGEKIVALKLESSYYIGSGSSVDYSGILDFDELDACIKSLKYIKENLITTIPQLYTEIEYKTRDGIKIGTYLANKTQWKLFIQTASYSNKSIKFIELDQLDNIISVFEKSKQLLSEKK